MGKATTQKRLSNPTYIGIFVVLGIIFVVGAVMLGKSDGGEIDVNDAITASNQANIDRGGDPNENVGTTQNALKDRPNGGLVPKSSQETVPAPAPTPEPDSVVEDTSTSTGTTTVTETDGSTSDESAQNSEVPTEEESTI